MATVDPGLATIIAALIVASATILVVLLRRRTANDLEQDTGEDDHGNDNDSVDDIEIANEAKVVRKGDYEVYSHSFSKGDILDGEVSSDSPIDIYVVNSRNLKAFKNNQDFTDIDGKENVTRLSLTTQIPSRGKWYIILENSGSKAAEVDVNLTATTEVE